jgi:integrase
VVSNCPIIVACPGRLCHSCGRALAKGDLSEEEFIATYVPKPSKRLVYTQPGLCRVGGRKGKPCQRLEKARGLCTSHYNRWYKLVRAGNLTDTDDDLRLWAETQDGLAALARCIVAGCDMARNADAGLCTPHYQKWFYDSKQNRRDIDEWAQWQAPAMTGAQFSLAPLQPVVRLELLYGIQTRDVLGANVCPAMLRSLVRHLTVYKSLAFLREGQFDPMALPNKSSGFMVASVIRDLHRELDMFNGVDPTSKTVWDMRAVAMHEGHAVVVRSGGRVRRRGLVDFGVVTQPWLRDLLMAWARTTKPRPTELATMVLATRVGSDALAKQAGAGRDATTLTFAHMTAVANEFRGLLKDDGEPYADKQRGALSFQFFKLIDFGRKAGLLDQVPGEFARHESHRIAVVRFQDEDDGKALPESVIRQLDENLGSLAVGVPYANLPAAAVSRMFQTIYRLLRDTGRRPLEIAALDTECLERVSDDSNLIWDNFKAKRMRRRLPIDGQTARIIQEWQEERRNLRTIAHSPDKLFPAPGAISTTPHIPTASISTVLREWVTSLERIDSEVIGEDGEPEPFDRSKIYPYVFRHSYAQRHADAGTPIDVLKELMDHREASVLRREFDVDMRRGVPGFRRRSWSRRMALGSRSSS